MNTYKTVLFEENLDNELIGQYLQMVIYVNIRMIFMHIKHQLKQFYSLLIVEQYKKRLNMFSIIFIIYKIDFTAVSNILFN